ncbi:MAG: hypothetical protein KAW92_13210 [Candidatus Cloacimonetes bacterium]|nr:hypothetical protein [Candidatus Cloacimonadota bacterium]
MAVNSKFNVYIGKYIPKIGNPLVVITGKEFEGTLLSEYFIFIENHKRKEFFALRLESRKINFKDALNIDLDYMMEEALRLSEAQIDNFIFNQYTSKSPLRYFDFRVKLEKSKHSSLARLFLNNNFNDEFKFIIDQSRNDSLLKFFELLDKWQISSIEIKTFYLKK